MGIKKKDSRIEHLVDPRQIEPIKQKAITEEWHGSHSKKISGQKARNITYSVCTLTFGDSG